MTPIHFLVDLREIDKGDLARGHFVANRPSFGRFDSVSLQEFCCRKVVAQIAAFQIAWY